MMRFLLFFVWAAYAANPPYYDYKIHCQQAVDDEEVFATFKRNKHYNEVLEHVSQRLGQEYLNFIQENYPYLLAYFDRFKQNDTIGNPKMHHYRGVGLMSPTTLRYIKVAGDLRARFGDLAQKHILELGGGYGGQCKILFDLGGFASYTIVDLSVTNALAKKYLAKFQIPNVHFVDTEDLSPLNSEYDLCISNYGYLEFGRMKQERYFPLLRSSQSGYMTGNFPPYSHYISQEELLLFSEENEMGMVAEPERPSSGEGNLIITWKESGN